MTLRPIFGSSNLAAVGYADGQLVVRFKGGGAFRYDGVPPELHAALLAAPSKGAYFYQHVVRNTQYPATKLTQAEIDGLQIEDPVGTTGE